MTRCLLIADDSKVMRDLVAACLRPLGEVSFDFAASGLEAIERLALTSYQLVVLDLNMPDVGGIEVIESIRQKSKLSELPILVVTRGTVMRDGVSSEAEDLVSIETCVEYSAMAFEKASSFDAEQAMRRQLQTILDHLPISVVVAEPSGAITHMNQTTTTVSPALRGQSMEGVHDRMRLRTAEGEPMTIEDSPLSRAFRGESVRGIELEATFDDDKPRYLRASAVPLYDGKGAVTSAILAFDDITVEKMAAAEREQAMEFQRYVLGIVSHDLRSPLQTLVMGCEGIRMMARDNAKVLQFVARMENTTLRMRGIIEQLLDVVRTQLGGGIPVAPSEVGLDEVVTSVLGELSMAYPSAQFELVLDRVRGNWDRDRLAQVIANLVGNAIQHGAKQSPIWIETERAGDEALLRVRNRSANALTDDQMGAIFAPFRRTKIPAAGNGGLGLGLYIASEILRAHDGDITVESDSTMTTFVVRLPIRPTATA